MKMPTDMLRLKGFSFPRDIISYAVWTYHRFALSAADVEGLLAELGVIVVARQFSSGSIVSEVISPNASGVTGQNLTINGIWTKW